MNDRQSLQTLANAHARRVGIDPNLFSNVITQESGWNPTAVSPKGAEGIGQVMPNTARDPGYGVTPLLNPKDPVDNIRFSADYLSAMIKEHGGNVPQALAAYNTGPGNVAKFGFDGTNRDVLPEETQGYLANIYDPLQGQSGQPETRMAANQLQQEYLQNNPQFAGGSSKNPQEQEESQGFLGSVQSGVGDFWDKVKNTDYGSERWNDNFLAIGSGLLSGSNWNEGFANAAQGLQGVDQVHDERAFQEKMAQQRAAQSSSDAFTRIIGNSQLSDGRQVFTTMKNGRFYTAGGEDVTDLFEIEINNSDAAGSRGQLSLNQYNDQITSLQDTENTLRSLDRVFESAQDLEGGLAGKATDIGKFFNTLTNRGLTNEQLQRGLTQADIQGLIGSTRTDVVGPGVMTEQDALRVIMAIGGDMQTLSSNPEILAERIQTLRQPAQRRYDQTYRQLQAHNERYPNLPYQLPETYTTPDIYDDARRGNRRGGEAGGTVTTGVLDSSNEQPQELQQLLTDVDEILNQQGL